MTSRIQSLVHLNRTLLDENNLLRDCLTKVISIKLECCSTAMRKRFDFESTRLQEVNALVWVCSVLL